MGNQHAYQSGKSCDSALHSLVEKVERTLESKEIALGAFLDVEGAFDNTPTRTIFEALTRFGVNPVVANWILGMLNQRSITATLGGCKKRVFATAGCPQGGGSSRHSSGAWWWTPCWGDCVLQDIMRRDMRTILRSW